jgi:Mor family transcriptional regulator
LSRNPENNDLVSVLEQEVRATARSFGVSAADAMAASLIDRVLLRLGSGRVYIPKRETLRRNHARVQIRASFTGNNLHQLAADFGMSPRHIRRILEA